MPENDRKKQKRPKEDPRGEREQSEKKLPPIVRKVPDPPVPNRAHTEM